VVEVGNRTENETDDPKKLLNWPATPKRLGIKNTKRRNFVITSDEWVNEEKEKISMQEKKRSEIEERKQKRLEAKQLKEAQKKEKQEQKAKMSKTKKKSTKM
jgi:hypothetical protein